MFLAVRIYLGIGVMVLRQTLTSCTVPKVLSILVCVFELAAVVLTSYPCLTTMNAGYRQGKSLTSFVVTQGV